MALIDNITKALESFYKSCKYEKFAYKYQDYMSNKKLSDDVKNYLRILNTNFLFLVDERGAFREYDRITRPTVDKYLQAYYFLEIIVLAKKKEFNEAKNRLDFLRKHKSLSKEDLYSLELFIDIYSDRDVEDIEKKFVLNNRVLYQNIFNARLLMDYFALKGDKKCLEYAKFIARKRTDLTETVNRAKEIIDIFK